MATSSASTSPPASSVVSRSKAALRGTSTGPAAPISCSCVRAVQKSLSARPGSTTCIAPAAPEPVAASVAPGGAAVVTGQGYVTRYRRSTSYMTPRPAKLSFQRSAGRDGAYGRRGARRNTFFTRKSMCGAVPGTRRCVSVGRYSSVARELPGSTTDRVCSGTVAASARSRAQYASVESYVRSALSTASSSAATSTARGAAPPSPPRPPPPSPSGMPTRTPAGSVCSTCRSSMNCAMSAAAARSAARRVNRVKAAVFTAAGTARRRNSNASRMRRTGRRSGVVSSSPRRMPP